MEIPASCDITPTHAQNQTHHERARGTGGVVNSITVTFFCSRHVILWEIPRRRFLHTLKYFSHPLGPRPQHRFFFLSSSLFFFFTAIRKGSHTWVSHVKQLIPWNTPFKWVFWSLGLPIVMKRLVSSHVSLAQVPSLPAHQIINITRDGERERGWWR